MHHPNSECINTSNLGQPSSFLIFLKNIAVFKSLQFLLVRKPDCILPSLCVELVVLAWSAAVCDPGLRSSFFFLHCSIADDLLFFPFEFRPDLMCHARTHTHTSSVLQKTRRNSGKSNLFMYVWLRLVL